MTEIKSCGCSPAARRTRHYRTENCQFFHYDYVDGSLRRHADRDRCCLCGRRYALSHARELVHPATGCPNAPTIVDSDIEVPLFWRTSNDLIPRSATWWRRYAGSE